MRRRTSGVAVAILATLAACNSESISPSDKTTEAAPSFATSSTGATVITDADVSRQAEDTPPLRNWVLYTRLVTPGTGTFRAGPATPPEGAGSIEFGTVAGTDKVYLFNFDYAGKTLSSLTSLSYSSYRSTGSLQQVTALNIQVDINGGTLNPGEFTTLVFEPVYNTGQGAVVSGAWQDWDAYNGGNAIWWSSRPIPGVCAFDCFVTWNAIVAANPNATVLGGMGFNQGSGNPALTAAVDALTIGFSGQPAVTYDFELFVTARTKEDCKNGGWQSVRRSDGSTFKNQGDCVSYTSNGR